MTDNAKRMIAFAGMFVVLTCELLAVIKLSVLAASRGLIVGFGILAGLGFWAMSIHRLGR